MPATTDAARAALNTGLRVLREGKLLGIYPEGTRSPDGRLYRGKTGVARLALESGAVVLPCAMIDTDKVQPQDKRQRVDLTDVPLVTIDGLVVGVTVATQLGDDGTPNGHGYAIPIATAITAVRYILQNT